MIYANEITDILTGLGVCKSQFSGGDMTVHSPLTGEAIADVPMTTADVCHAVIDTAQRAFFPWRDTPAPRRGELVRLLGEQLRASKRDLGRLISIEVGKIPSEGLGEVQEMIDICDFAVGQSRQLHGLTIATERTNHRMMETWHPLGPVAIITAFNFPAAVWAWNAALALVCGDPVITKPSEKAPLTALACDAILRRALKRFGDAPKGLASTVYGTADLGDILVNHPAIALVSATGSTRMGRAVAPKIAKRFARSILELGGNNAAIVCPSADIALTIRAIAFGAMGTAGQRCTTTRRAIVHNSVYDQVVAGLKKAYGSISVGNPLTDTHLVGPLIDKQAFDTMQSALQQAHTQGGNIVGGERVDTGYGGAYYVRPALVEMPGQRGIVSRETFAPILYVMRYTALADAIAMHNAVGAGLSSAIFTMNIREAEAFISSAGSDCGIANVNIGTSGAEIGGAFGGEKETGGGRESGSDAWKAYMRRATNTINFSTELPLAQGVVFDI